MLFLPKALCAKDHVIAKSIFEAKSAKDTKKVSYNITGISEQKWHKVTPGIIEVACHLKFSQNLTLKEKLINTLR